MDTSKSIYDAEQQSLGLETSEDFSKGSISEEEFIDLLAIALS